jgi:hypothetical protein
MTFRDCDRCKNKGGPGVPCRTCGRVNDDPDDAVYRARHGGTTAPDPRDLR